MKTITSTHNMQCAARELRTQGKRLALVPTMGFLHEGHLSLIRIAKQQADVVVLSLFVNPTQFGPGEDFEAYPRDEARDAQLCRNEGVDILFAPTTDDMYARNTSVYIGEDALSDTLCGRSRPHHFRGVLTVVAKLFNACTPDVAIFGQKDAQQLALIRKMVSDLNFPIDIVGAPIVREGDGVAMSSRNAYLSEKERADARVLSEALESVRSLHGSGERDAETLQKALVDHIATAPSARLDYAEIVDATSLKPVPSISGPTLVAVAAHFGPARLIDNIVLDALPDSI